MNPAGYAFVRCHGTETRDNVFIPASRVGAALDGDEVLIRSWPGEKGDEGQVEEVIGRKRRRLVGMVEKRRGSEFVLVPDDPRIRRRVRFRMSDDGLGFDASQPLLISAKILEYPTPSDDYLEVCFERILGEPGLLDTEIRKILIEHEVEDEFPDEVLEQAKSLPKEVRPEDLEGRMDLRHLPFMTIDPPDARDFDDAVAVERLGDDPACSDYRLWVAVADVSHYVREGSPVDTWAVEQCFSTYLPHRAIPMLPPEWSSHMCSLVPKEDRLAMVVSMTIDPAGEIREVDVMAGVIHSQERLSYDQVAEVLAAGDGEDADGGLEKEIRDRIFELRRVADVLRAARLRRGAIELNLTETKVLLDEDDRLRIRDVQKSRSSKEMTRAYNLIEEMMLVANEAMGHLAVKEKLPVVYRVHDKPNESKLMDLSGAAASLGVKSDPEKLQHPRGAQKFLSRVASRPQAQALNMLMLRAMSQAEYRTENIGHFALASSAYLHFTSPIRRYPDLIVHRVMKAYLERRKKRGKESYPGPKPVPKMPVPLRTSAQAETSCTRERSVSQAERDVKALFMTSFMQDRIGDRFEAQVSRISAFGIFVQLDDPYVDGMMKYAELEREWNEKVERDDTGIRIVGQQSGRVLTIGDKVVVDLEHASLPRRQIDFVLVSVLHSSG